MYYNYKLASKYATVVFREIIYSKISQLTDFVLNYLSCTFYQQTTCNDDLTVQTIHFFRLTNILRKGHNY